MPTVTIKKNMHETLTVDADHTKYVLNKGVTIEGEFRGIDEGMAFTGNHYVLNGKVATTGVNGTALFSYAANADFDIGKSGLIKGDYGVYTQGAGAEVTNDGRIEAKELAVEMEGTNARLVNHGTIISHGNYAFFNVSSTEFTLINDGKMISRQGISIDGSDLTMRFGEDSIIKARNEVITLNSDTDETSTLVNKGLIEATQKNTFLKAVVGDEANETVRNSGKIVGDVSLGAGRDTFEDHGGKVVHGAVFGGEGSDTYVLASNHTRVYEAIGEGYDILEVKFSYEMEASSEIEEVHLLGKGNFKLVANELGVGMEGNAGDNKLIGGDGADTFYGGAGNDISRGGDGADAFMFRPDYGRETVMDFEDGVDHIVLQGDKIGSIAELLAHHVKDVDGGMLIYGDGTQMFLKGMDVAHFSADDFTG